MSTNSDALSFDERTAKLQSQKVEIKKEKWRCDNAELKSLAKRSYNYQRMKSEGKEAT